eukprot:scpid75904/ scgid6536/ 
MAAAIDETLTGFEQLRLNDDQNVSLFQDRQEDDNAMSKIFFQCSDSPEYVRYRKQRYELQTVLADSCSALCKRLYCKSGQLRDIDTSLTGLFADVFDRHLSDSFDKLHTIVRTRSLSSETRNLLEKATHSSIERRCAVLEAPRWQFDVVLIMHTIQDLMDTVAAHHRHMRARLQWLADLPEVRRLQDYCRLLEYRLEEYDLSRVNMCTATHCKFVINAQFVLVAIRDTLDTLFVLSYRIFDIQEVYMRNLFAPNKATKTRFIPADFEDSFQRIMASSTYQTHGQHLRREAHNGTGVSAFLGRQFLQRLKACFQAASNQLDETLSLFLFAQYNKLHPNPFQSSRPSIRCIERESDKLYHTAMFEYSRCLNRAVLVAAVLHPMHAFRRFAGERRASVTVSHQQTMCCSSVCKCPTAATAKHTLDDQIKQLQSSLEHLQIWISKV